MRNSDMDSENNLSQNQTLVLQQHPNTGDLTAAESSVYVWPGDCEDYSYRLSTFGRFDGLEEIQKFVKFASCGFFYTGCQNKAQCFSCDVIIEDWMTYDVDRICIDHKPSCEHALSHRASLFDKKPVFRHNAVRRVGSDVGAIVNGRDESTVDPESTETCYMYMNDVVAETYRLVSFRKCDQPFVPNMRRAAKEGFFYTGMDDRARCFSCGNHWNVSQVTYTTSLHENSCKMARARGKSGNIPMTGYGQVQDLLNDWLQPQGERHVSGRKGADEGDLEVHASKRRRLSDRTFD